LLNFKDDSDSCHLLFYSKKADLYSLSRISPEKTEIIFHHNKSYFCTTMGNENILDLHWYSDNPFERPKYHREYEGRFTITSSSRDTWEIIMKIGKDEFKRECYVEKNECICGPGVYEYFSNHVVLDLKESIVNETTNRYILSFFNKLTIPLFSGRKVGEVVLDINHQTGDFSLSAAIKDNKGNLLFNTTIPSKG